MKRALERVAAMQAIQRARGLEPLLRRVGRMPGAERLFKRIASAGDPDEIDDHRAAVQYALMFAGLAFDVSVEPSGSAGPDLSVSRDGYSAAVEVTRFRRVYSGPPASGSANMPGILPEYGDPPRDIKKVRDKVTSKLRQLRRGTGLVAIWNDDGDLEELEASQGVAEVAHDAVAGVLSVPPGLFLVTYASRWVHPRTKQQVHCFELQPSCPAYIQQWKAELESSLVSQLIQRAVSS